MSKFTCSALADQPKRFLAVTNLKLGEFEALLPCFQSAYRTSKAAAGRLADEQRGCTGKLVTLEDKLFSIFFHLKVYSL